MDMYYKMQLQEVGWGDMDWIYPIQYRERWLAIVKTVMNLRLL